MKDIEIKLKEWLSSFRNIDYMRKIHNYNKRKITFKDNLIWVLIYVFLSLNISSLSPFFVSWTKRREGKICLSKIEEDLNYHDLLVVDLIKEEQMDDIAKSLASRNLNQLKSFQYTYATYKDIGGGKPLIVIHEVRRRENLWTVARKYGVTVDTIRSFNDLENRTISVRQRLKIPSKKGILHKIRKRESLWDISRAYKLSLNEILKANNISNTSMLRPGQAIFLPGVNYNYRYYKGYQKDYQGKLPSFMIRPVSGRISSGFGNRRHPIFGRMMFHAGIDVKAPCGTKIKAAMSGKVAYSGWYFGLGRTVMIIHENNYATRYAHNLKNLVKAGEYVKQGQVIALVGSSGLATGPHLHFEVHKKGIPQNPLKYLPR